jgi:murein DD-endopeptidase MepM/ murein hydrolase activator NlpD
MMLGRRVLVGVVIAGLAVLVAAAAFIGSRRSPAIEATSESNAAPELITETIAIASGDTLEDILRRAGMDTAMRVQAISAASAAFDLRKFRAGSNLVLIRSAVGEVEGLEYAIDPDHNLQMTRNGGGFHAAIADVPGTIETTPVCGVIVGSLVESVARLGERPELTLRIAYIFGWQLDFYSDPREGDEFCALVEKKEYANGQPATYRRVLAATYNNAGTFYDAYLFQDESGAEMYFSGDGKSLRSSFLRSPMRFDARVSSHFSMARRHPVLRIVRPHLGTDYAAPTGTPVQAIGAGTVTFAAYSGNSGNLIKIRHTNGYETQYLHLSRILVCAGQHVEQGQQIGHVGATGLATGPHLDFRLSRNGRYVNFERLRLPPDTALSAQRMAQFSAERDHFTALMRGANTTPRPALARGALSVSGGAGQ